MKFLKKIAILIGLILFITSGIALYVYSDHKAEENRIEYLESLADRYNKEVYLSTYINILQDVYKKTKDDSLGIYLSKKHIELKNEKKNGFYHDKIASNQYFVLQDAGDEYKLYEEKKEKFTKKKNIKDEDIEKIADIDNYKEILSSHNSMIKEIKSLRGANNLPYKLQNTIAMLNIMEGHDIDYIPLPKSIMQEISDFIEDSWDIIKWILIVLFISAIANILSGEKVLGFNSDSKDDEIDIKNNTKPKKPTKTTDDKKILSVQEPLKEKINLKVEETNKIQESRKVGEVNLIIDDIFNARDRKKNIMYENEKFICSVDAMSSSLKASTMKELKMMIENYYIKEDFKIKIKEF